MIALTRNALLTLLALAPLVPSLLAQPTPPAASHARIGALLDSLDQVKSIGPLALSPDGKSIAMVLAGNLTLQSLNGSLNDPLSQTSPARTPTLCQPTGAKQAALPSIRSLTWAPDGQHLAALATCDQATAVYLIEPASHKAARKLAEVHGFAKALQYSPDGKHLAMLYVEGASRPSGALAAMKPPSGVIGVEGLEIQRIATIDPVTGQLQQVTPPKLHVYEFDWSPDSTKLAFVAAPAPGENNWWVARLYIQPLAAAEPQQILDPVTVEGPLHGLQIAVPRWSPDGSKIAFIGGLMSDQGATGGDIYLLPSTGGEPVNLTAGATTTVQWIHWTPAEHLLATLIDGGSTRIEDFSFTFPPSFHAPGGAHVLTTNRLTGKTLATLPDSLGDGRLESSFSLSRDATIAAWSASSLDHAPEVYAGPLATPLPSITHLNTDLKPTWGKTESITWQSDGFPGEPAGAQHTVQGWLLYPADYNPSKHYPMIVMVHGGPSSAVTPRWPYAGFGAAPFSALGYFVLEANPRGSYGEGEAFTQANRKDFGYGDLRDILAGVDAVEKRLPIDDHRLGLTGWSYGGFMTMFGVTQTQRFHAAVAGAGISDWLSYYGENSIDQWMTPFFGDSVYNDPAVYARSSAITYIKQVKTPTLVVVGDRDGECPAPQSFEFWHALKAEGVDTQLVVYPNEGHGFVDPAHRRDVIERAANWFDTHLQ